MVDLPQKPEIPGCKLSMSSILTLHIDWHLRQSEWHNLRISLNMVNHGERSARRCASQLPEKRVFFFECTNSGCCPKNKLIFLAASPIDLASSIVCLFDCARQNLTAKIEEISKPRTASVGLISRSSEF